MSEKDNEQQRFDEQIETTELQTSQEPEPKITSSSQPGSAKKVVEPPAAKTKKAGNGLAWLALLLSLTSIGAIGGAYWFWQKLQTQQQQSLQSWQAGQAEQMQTLEQALRQQISTSQTQSMTEQQQVTAKLQSHVNEQLSAMEGRVQQISGRQPNDWVLAEAQYLIRIAGRKLWLEHDIETALNLLATARVRVVSLGDSSLHPLQKAIFQDITALKGLPNTRVEDFHHTLSALIGGIDQLPVNMIKRPAVLQQQQDESQAPAVVEDSMWANFVASLSGLNKLFVFKTGVAEGKIEPLMNEQQQWYLKASFKLAALQAQLAVLERKTAVYNDAIDRAIGLLAQFKQTDASVQAAILQLTELRKGPLDAPYPKRFVSEAMLATLIHERLGQALPESPEVPAVVEVPEQAPGEQQ